MTDRQLKIIIGGLLHDIGKILYRDNDGRNHSQSGYDFLKENDMDDKEILDQIRYHHGKYLKNAKIQKNSLAYITYIADNIASAADRREKENGMNGFQKDMALESIFNILNNNHDELVYQPQMLNHNGSINFPIEGEIEYNKEFYHEIIIHIKDMLKGLELKDDYINSLLEVLEADLSFVPSSTSKKEVADISLYDHLKMTAAIGSCILEYMEDAHITDWKEALFDESESFYEKEVFLIYSIDISGIQDFIYTITSEKALKSLRSRSFYLEILMEHLVDEMLEEIGLSRANLIYTGGGHAYMLLPNTKRVKEKIEAKERAINQEWINKYQNALFLAGGYQECSANALKNKPKGSYRKIFRGVSNRISEKKMHRYDADEIRLLQRSGIPSEDRECRVCHRTDELTEEGKCKFCSQVEDMSNAIFRGKFFTVVEDEPKENHIALTNNRYLIADSEDTLKNRMEKDNFYIRIYGKNEMYTGMHVATKLWVGEYHTEETLEELAKKSLGIERIAVLRADVDNLGQAFVRGFESEEMGDHYVTISRTATFSRKLSMFFKYHINGILNNGEYFLEDREGKKRNIAIVYSGGDDVFFMGSWDDVLGAAIDLNHNLRKYTQNTLHISAGYGIYPAKYPVANMAEETGKLEELSKECPEKNSITLFEKGNTYHWNVLEEKVLGEKFRLLKDFFNSREDKGKSTLYHLLELIRHQEEKINLARYAYFLARLQPSEKADPAVKELYTEFSKKMYQWIGKNEDRRQLLTAIYIYAYTIREKEEEKHGAK